MRLEQASASVLPFRRAATSGATLEAGRLANLAFMAVIFVLAALWLVFPPAQLPG